MQGDCLKFNYTVLWTLKLVQLFLLCTCQLLLYIVGPLEQLFRI